MSKQTNKVGIAGSGTMGSGIAQLAASADYEVILIDLSNQLLKKAVSRINKNLTRLVDKEKVDKETQQQILSRTTTSTKLDDLADCDLVVEAVSENINIKKELFEKLDSVLKEDCIIASNTSTLPIIQLATITSRPEKVVGIHFFNPAPAMKLVEIVKSLATSKKTIKIAEEFTLSLGKEPVVTKDRPGFIVNRILIPMLNEAVFALDEAMGTPEDIDKAMKLGTNHPMGPLELIDLIGLDVTLDILDVLFAEFKDSKYRACPLLRQKVRAGHLGRKSGRGFYDYK
ncbi:MAG: 3-hydroxybutyryl-CoA dehydrogenase [Candidatus Dadabacteria bacterium]|nr:3-hydroxybutyryl-CoA dehydrogenase [Candidatus Dadabacteria bacterium]NIS10055.1 3-hydroxybutyryl-CoA dehydrogenase [Candidatus Dadabacteria bacterium]NIV42132.1 3-hydroxybutyryl-CoA dehydrogenase [Candidatus Dadabacteria bacterium]NIX16441.1 3-hydroxybutyryl-CoA dehydrogenase [Candidatus Dadabacteria bacterium]NIY23002.1 3-hydroxybutyryl-CoA dehydrogenase [Candidatus Dadabacteria bacterium]